MAATQTAYKHSCSIKLDNGTTPTGTQKTVSVSLGTLGEISSWDANKAMNIISLLGEIFDKDMVRIDYTVVSTLRG